MAYSKIIYGGNVLIDLTADTVAADKLLSGGSPIMQKSRRVSLSDEKEGLFALSGANFYFGEIVLLPLRGMGDYARRIRDCLGQIADDAAVTIIDVELPRFKTGDAKAVLGESVRGKDVYIIVDVGNFAQTTLQLKLRKNITSYLPKNIEPDNVLLLVRTPRQIAELTEKNAPIGAMDVINGSEVITAAVPLVAAHDITEQETGGSGFGKVLLWIFIIILLLAAALFVIRTINIYRYRKRRARRAAAQRAKARQQAAAQRRQ